MEYLNEKDILIIHALIIDETGGSHGVRDTHLLGSLAVRPKTSFGGREQYQDVWSKAAAYLEAIVSYHVFTDGNKRTGIAVVGRFLYLNGYDLRTTNEALVAFVLEVVTKKLDIDTIAGWLKEHSKKIRK